MKVSLSFALLSATSAWAAKASLSSVQHGVTNLPGSTNKFIVEVTEASNIPGKRALGTPHEQLYRSLRERKISFDVHKEYDAPGIFVGAALTLNSAADVADILSAEGVLAIRPVVLYSRPAPLASKKVSPGDAGLPDGQSTHISTGVDKLHALGITGKGIKIGILDTGIDYTHPTLGGGFGAGFKVAGGFDLVGDAYTGSDTPVPDSDPLDQCAGHGSLLPLTGTHVAGIIGANPGNEFNISGVAYDASIYSYRIFGCTGSVGDDVIVDALLMGAKAKMDILTLSLGGSNGWTEGSGNVVASRIAASGKIVTIAAGNEGASGSWFTSGPGNAIDAISVASSENTLIPLQTLTIEGATHDPIVYYDTLPLPVTGSLPLFATSNDTTVLNDACNDTLPATTPDLSKFVVLVRRGTCAFTDKLANVAAFGAKTVLIYDNGNGFAGIEVGKFQAVLIQAEDGVFLGQQLASGASISVTFPQTGGGVQMDSPTGGLVSTFTTYGPTNDFYFKPAITAPGGNILSTLPVPLGSWGLESGTSMATPFMAGSAALLLAAKGKSAFRCEDRAHSLPVDCGAGLVQVYDAIYATTILSRTELILNDTTHFAGPQKFTVKNAGKKAKTYTLSHVPAGTAVTITAGTIFSPAGPRAVSHEVVATITPPKGVDASTFPVYSGFIHVTSGAETLHATYLGVAAALKDKQVLDDTDTIFGVPLPMLPRLCRESPAGPLNYTFNGTDAPTLLWRQAFGTPLLRVDLVAADIAFNATHKRAVSFVKHQGGTFSKVPIVGALQEIDYFSRNDEGDLLDNTVVLTTTFANGTAIPAGTYKVLLRSLRVTGDPTNEADYESWLSPIFGVVA
ncbi:subtilisin-like protease [Mycena filopes]|nr:subtilisin-like protease [Mycena filopes]